MANYTTKRAAGEPVWLELVTSDLEAATSFYRQVLGWDYVDTGADFGRYHLALARGHNAAGITPMQPDMQIPSAWAIYFSSDDAAADAERVKALGGEVIFDVMAVGDLGTMALCADPTGAVFGLWQAGTHIGASIDGEPGAMAWCEVSTSDSAAAREFYGKLFDLTPQRMEGDTEYYIMHRGEQMVCGILQIDSNWAGIPPHWMCYFAVDNTDAAIERAIAAGGKLAVPAFDIAYGRMAVLTDPGNANVSIVQLPDGPA
jgi:predicted enzyme related to lactoylglutathione lyase